MTQKKSQNDRVLQYMRDFGSITALDAFRDLGCQRLASRIDDLKRMGHIIHTEYIVAKNAYNEPMRYARYSLTEPRKEEAR